ncbi:unnamed protein product [Heligmosomoides polygyrus]|uniref:CN hydrolase domain-containing protein n=1 Tax=Heligmosomoides polygyrus TaxID=6339 RepID=A0A183FU93_HELPZ|nr:unnamed protein product [Heligmosomoides polygyrus]
MDFHTRGSKLAVTDLGTSYYSTFFIYNDAIQQHGMGLLKAWSGRRLRRATGVLVDDDGKAVVADAASHKIHVNIRPVRLPPEPIRPSRRERQTIAAALYK